jgi:hypothetical protein
MPGQTPSNRGRPIYRSTQVEPIGAQTHLQRPVGGGLEPALLDGSPDGLLHDPLVQLKLPRNVVHRQPFPGRGLNHASPSSLQDQCPVEADRCSPPEGLAGGQPPTGHAELPRRPTLVRRRAGVAPFTAMLATLTPRLTRSARALAPSPPEPPSRAGLPVSDTKSLHPPSSVSSSAALSRRSSSALLKGFFRIAPSW